MNNVLRNKYFDMETKMLNFRCPSELLDSIDEWGKENYPSDNKNGCDRSKTLIHIIEAGLMALNDGSVEVERKTQGKTDGKTELNTEELKAALRNELLSEVEGMFENLRGEVTELVKPKAR